MFVIVLLTCSLLGQNPQRTPPAPERQLVPAVVLDKEAERRTMQSFVWSGVLSNRQALRKGVYHASGRKTETKPKLGHIEGEVHIFCAFDFDEGKFRFDRVEPFIETLPDAPADSPNWVKAVRDSRYLRVPDKSIIHLRGRGRTHIESEESPVPYAVNPIDVRAVGLMDYYQTFGNKLNTIDVIVNNWMKSAPDEDVAEEGGIHRIGWVSEKGSPLNYQNTFWVDEAKGFAPVRFEFRKRIAKPKIQKWSEPIGSGAATWTSAEGVWIPKTWHIEDSQVANTGGSYDLTFEWESVNQPVPAKYFTVEGLELDKGEMLVDMRLKQPIIIGTIGDDHALTIGIEGGDSAMPPPRGGTQSTRNWPRWRFYTLATLCAIAAAGFCIYWRRRGGTA